MGGNGNNTIYPILSTEITTWTEPEAIFELVAILAIFQKLADRLNYHALLVDFTWIYNTQGLSTQFNLHFWFRFLRLIAHCNVKSTKLGVILINKKKVSRAP